MLDKYDTIQKIGKGAYGVVWKAVEKSSQKVVAIKKIYDAFTNNTDSQRTFREVFLLQEMGPHVNIIKILNLRKASNEKDLYIIFELMETDLHTVIRAEICRDV